MTEQGFGGLVAEAPMLFGAALVAQDCWNFCGGWRPTSWPLYEAISPVEDWPLTIELMLFIRRNK